MTTNRVTLTPRVKACLQAGDAETLELLLATWSQEELRLARKELRASYHKALEEMDEDYVHDCKEYDYLLSEAGRALADQRYKDRRTSLAEVFAEIEGAIRLHLKEKQEEKSA